MKKNCSISMLTPTRFVHLHTKMKHKKIHDNPLIFRGCTIKLKFNIAEYGRLTLLNLRKSITVNICPCRAPGTLRAPRLAKSMFLDWFMHIWTPSLTVIIDWICHTFITLVVYCNDKANHKFLGMVSINDNFPC